MTSLIKTLDRAALLSRRSPGPRCPRAQRAARRPALRRHHVAASIDANNLKFSTAELAVPSDAPFKLFFRNLEGAPHNVAIYGDSSASEKIFVGETITNAAITYDIPAIPAGEYFFRCDVHPDMTGAVQAG